MRTVCMLQGSKRERMAIGINKNKLYEHKMKKKKDFFVKLKSSYLEWKRSNKRYAFKNMEGLKIQQDQKKVNT